MFDNERYTIVCRTTIAFPSCRTPRDQRAIASGEVCTIVSRLRMRGYAERGNVAEI